MITSALVLGNRALLEKDYEAALGHFRVAQAQQPGLAKIIQGNIALAERRLKSSRRHSNGFAPSTESATPSLSTPVVDIVVPVFNALEYVKRCLSSLASHNDGIAVRVIVVNDGSDMATTEWLRQYCQGKPQFQLIEQVENSGYTRAVNLGLNVSTARFVITQNSDTVVTKGWLKRMVRCMTSDPKIGIVGPLSNAAGWQTVPQLRDGSGRFAINELPSGLDAEAMARLVAEASMRSYPRLPFVNGFCFMIRREVINAIGYMDEESFPVGYGEESDYCIRAIDAGYHLAVADDVYVLHAKSKSFGHERRKSLSDQGNSNLKRKHGTQKYAERLALAMQSGSMDIVRARINDAIVLKVRENKGALPPDHSPKERTTGFLGTPNGSIDAIREWSKKTDSPDIPKMPMPKQALQLQNKLPITVLIVTWDVGHNPLGRSYMLAEVVQRIARHSLLVGFQFPRYGETIWEPVRNGELPIISLPGSNMPEFLDSLERISDRIKPDVVIACKPRLPSVALGMLIKEKWGCPLIVDIDDHELSFFKNQQELSLSDLAAMPESCAGGDNEPYTELWTRLTQSLSKCADEIIVSNVALQAEFGGTIVPHVRNENAFDPARYDKNSLRKHYDIDVNAKIVLFFGTPRVHKGVDTLARAISKIEDRRFKLLVVGTAPDRSVVEKLDTLAPGRIVYLPNQPFASIPEVLAMADVVCLPQDEGHAISQYQLPAKAIDAVAMGIPLLVSNTRPLMQLVNDGVAELVSTEDIPAAIERLGTSAEKFSEWQSNVRSKFLSRYSYSAAALQMRDVIQRNLSKKELAQGPKYSRLKSVIHRALGLTPLSGKTGVDVVLFWKQNDTALYGRRHDMVIKYLASRPDVRKVVVFDAPISEFELIKRQQTEGEVTQHRWIYTGTYEKMLGVADTEKVSYNVFVMPPGKFRNKESDTTKPHLNEGYLPFIGEVLLREQVEARSSIFWIYPKNYLAPALIEHFQPKKVVVDVVDDHRAWPGVSDDEKKRLTENYREILSRADMAMTNCEPVQKSMHEFFPGVLMIPNGCDSSPPSITPKKSQAFEEFCSFPGKTIGFVGNLESKIDIELLRKVAETFSDCQLVLIGSTHANPSVLNLLEHKNVKMPGVVPYSEASSWVSKFDVGLIPHLHTDLTHSMNPLKCFVYLANKVQVVATAISNIDTSTPLIKFARDHASFILAVEAALKNPAPDNSLFEAYIQENNWKARMNSFVDKLLDT